MSYENTEDVEGQEVESGEMGDYTSKTVIIENNSDTTVNLYF